MIHCLWCDTDTDKLIDKRVKNIKLTQNAVTTKWVRVRVMAWARVRVISYG